MKTRNPLHLLVVFCLVATLAGCLDTGAVDANGVVSEDLHPYVTAGVLLALDQSPNIKPERVIEVVKTIRATTNLDGTITADELIKAANLAIHMDKLQPGERLVVQTLLVKIEDVLRKQGVNSAKLSATADRILTWTEEAARIKLASSAVPG